MLERHVCTRSDRNYERRLHKNNRLGQTMSHNKGGFDFGAVSDRDVIDISDSDHYHSAMLQSLVLMLGMALNSIATVTAMNGDETFWVGRRWGAAGWLGAWQLHWGMIRNNSR